MTEHEEPQDQEQEQDQPQPIGPSGGDDSDSLSSPEPGYPAGDIDPLGGKEGASLEHPEDIADTKSDEHGQEDVTQSPGAPADPDTPGV